MLFQDVIFWLLGIVAIGAALGVVLIKDLFRAALLLVLVFVAVAGFFVMLNAEFLAVVQVLGVRGRVPFVKLAHEPPLPGDPVIVMGYPLGLKALMARSDADFIDRLRREGVVDFFEQAGQLAAESSGRVEQEAA